MDIGSIICIVLAILLVGLIFYSSGRTTYEGEPKKDIPDGTYDVKFIENTFGAIRLIVYSRVNEAVFSSPIYYEFPESAVKIQPVLVDDSSDYNKLNRLKVETYGKFKTIVLWIDSDN